MSWHFFCYRSRVSSHKPLAAGGRDEATSFDGTNFKPRKRLENAPTPTTTPALACGASVVSVLFRGSGARCVRRHFGQPGTKHKVIFLPVRHAHGMEARPDYPA